MSDGLEEILYTDNSETAVMKSVTEMGMRTIVQYLDMIEPQTQELQAVKDHIATYVEKAYDEMYWLFTKPKQKYDTICHGDPWVNNLLFLHDSDGKIIDLKFVDYQIIRYTSLSTDILYFIYSSVQTSLIEKSFESLLKIYHNEFLNELRRSHVAEKVLAQLGMEWLNAELHTYAFYGVIIGIFLINAILAEEEDVRQFEEMEFGPMNPEYLAKIDLNSAVNQKKRDRIKRVVFHYYRRLHLGIINDDIEPVPITG